MKIFSWNVNGIRAVVKKGDFVKFIKKYDPDILCLQETKAKQGQAQIDLPKYEEFWQSSEKKGYAGVAIFSKIKPEKVIYGIPERICKLYSLNKDKYGDLSKEGRVLTLEFAKFFLTTVYTPNAKDDLSRIDLRHKKWDPAFLTFIKELKKSKPVIFCGDLNVAHTKDDLTRPKENEGRKGFTKEEREGFENLLLAGFFDTFRIFKKGNGFYTWWSHFARSRERNIGWRIDYFLASNELKSKIKKAEIHPEVLGSDHCPTSIVVDL